MNKNEDTTYKNVCSAPKAFLRKKFIAGNIYILKKKDLRSITYILP